MEELDIKWHIPSSMEIDVAIELLTTYAHKIMDKIRQLVTTPGPNFGYSMSRWQGWLKSILVGLAVLCEPESSVYGANSDNIYVRAVEKRPFKAGYPLSKSNRPQDYARMTQLRSEVGAVLLQSASSLVQGAGEDAVEAIKAVVKNIRLYTVFSGLGQADYEGYARILRYIKASVRAAEDHRNIPRGLLVKRVYVAHMTRVSHNTIHVMHRPEFDPLANILFQLSTSKYKEVRRSSQSALGALICSFPMYKYQFFPELLRLLASSTEEAQRGQANDDIIEGSIQMLKSSSFFGLGLHTWEYANHLLCTIVKAQKVEKPTSLVLIRKIFIEYLHQFSGISFDYQVAGNVSALAQKLIAVDIESPEALLIVAKKRQRTVVGRREYNALVNMSWLFFSEILHPKQ